MGKIKKNPVRKKPQAIIVLVNKIDHKFGDPNSPLKYTKRVVRLILTRLKKHPQKCEVLCPFCRSSFYYFRNSKNNRHITGRCIECGLGVSFNI